MSPPQDPNTIAPTTRTGVSLPPGNVHPSNFSGDPKGGAFVDWEQHYGRPIAKDPFLAKAEWAARDNPADAHFGGGPSAAPRMAGKFDARLPDGSGTGTGRPYDPGITGEDPFEGSHATHVDEYGGGSDDPAPNGVPPAGKMIGQGPPMPFQNMLAAFYRRDFGRPSVSEEDDTTPAPTTPAAPAAKMTAPAASGGWIDWEAGLTAMMENAEKQLQDLGAAKQRPFVSSASKKAKAHASAKARRAEMFGKLSEAQNRSNTVRDEFSFDGEQQAPRETGGAPPLLRPRPVEPRRTEKSLDVFDELEALVKSLEPLTKAAGHKYISRKANGHGGYDYTYAHPVSGSVHVSTEHDAKAHLGPTTSTFAGGAPKHSSVEGRKATTSLVTLAGGEHRQEHDRHAYGVRGDSDTLAAHHAAAKDTHAMKGEERTQARMGEERAKASADANAASAKVDGKAPHGQQHLAHLRAADEHDRAARAHGKRSVEGEKHAVRAGEHRQKAATAKQQHDATPDAGAVEDSDDPIEMQHTQRAEQASDRADGFRGTKETHQTAAEAHEKAAESHGAARNPTMVSHHREHAKYHREQAAKSTEKSMSVETITDTAGRPLSKGLYAYRLSGVGKTESVPDSLLYDYLCGFIEQAYEEQSNEVAHSKLDAHDQLGTMSASVMHALVEMIPHNANLLRACKKFSVTQEVIAKLLVEKGYYKPRSDSESTDDGLGAMGAHLLQQEGFAYSHQPTPFMSADMFAVPGLTLRGPVEQSADGMFKSDDALDPHILLGSAQRDAARSQWAEAYALPEGVKPIDDCPVHGGRDIHKAMNLHNPMLPCRCGARPNAYG